MGDRQRRPGSEISSGLIEGPDKWQDVKEAIRYATANDVVVVASAGNWSLPFCFPTPGGEPGVICTTATDRRELPTLYTHGAVKSDLLAVAAPGGDPLPGATLLSTLCGEGILTTWPVGERLKPCGHPDGYEEFAMTSASTPLVAGVAALLRALGCTSGETTHFITSTARHPLTGARGQWTPNYGYGVVDADAATSAAVESCRRSRN